MKPQLLSGARGKISFKDSDGNIKTLALVTDVAISEQEGVRPTYVIGALNPVSIEPLSLDVNCSIGRIIPVSKIDKTEALDKTTSFDHKFEEFYNQILSLDHVEITLEDKNPANPAEPKILGVVKYARLSGRSTSMSSGDVASERYNFIGIWDGGYGGDSNNAESINYGFEE